MIFSTSPSHRLVYQEKTTSIRLPPDELFRLTQLAVVVEGRLHLVVVANAALI